MPKKVTVFRVSGQEVLPDGQYQGLNSTPPAAPPESKKKPKEGES